MNISQDFKSSSVVKTLTAGVLALGLSLPFGAHAGNDNGVQKVNVMSQPTSQCSPLAQTSTGREVDASYSAHKYSQENVGAVGISIFGGRDLGSFSPHDLGTKLVKILEMNGVKAECFVHHRDVTNGTAVNFNVDGLAWKEDGFLNISESISKDTLRGVIAEAKTAKSLLASSSQPVAQLN